MRVYARLIIINKINKKISHRFFISHLFRVEMEFYHIHVRNIRPKCEIFSPTLTREKVEK